MRHCSSCEHCIIDIKSMFICNVMIDKCQVMGHHILNPAISGLRCKAYQREGTKNETGAKNLPRA